MEVGMKRLFVHGLFSLLACGPAWAVDNPLAASLDGSVVRYNGGYFGMAAQTNGVMMASDNLVDWTPAADVLEPVVGGPHELLYRNGLFFLYVQNRGYTVAARPTGPFPAVQRASFSAEDLRLFQDPGGELFSVHRNIGSKKEGEVWMRRYGAPWKPSGRPRQLLDGRRGMWDALDSADLGAPEMIGYRGNYYLLYAANSPSPRTGLREIGVAMNTNPEHFDNTDKQADPVLMRNVERLARTYSPILPTGEYAEWEGRYTLKPPAAGWTLPDFKMKGWRTGEGGFGFPFEDGNAQIHAGRTKWKTDHLWVRREFELVGGIPETSVLNIRHEGPVQVFLNGTVIFESAEPTVAYGNFDVSKEAAGAFRKTDNVLAVHAVSNQDSEFRFLDFGLFDAGTLPVEPTVYSLDTPRMFEGPNGFEKWLVYHAYWNGVPGTGLDRIFFFGEELVVDGPTTVDTPGYHPPPAQPTFSDGFPADDLAWREHWLFEGGEWASTNGALRQNHAHEPARALLRQKPAANYLFETYIRFPKKGKSEVGVVAYSDGDHELVISIKPAENSWGYRLDSGRPVSKKFKLPKEFKLLQGPPGFEDDSAPLHRVRITKNGGYFDVMLDQFKLTADKPIITPLTGAGVPGLFCRYSAAEFDGVAYTVGWDEHDIYITGWGSAADGSPAGGEWRHRKTYGLEQKRHSETGRAFKGDLLDQYEFTVNVRTEKLEEGEKRWYGVVPVFAGQQNYLKAMIDTQNRELVVSGKRNGEDVGPYAQSLKRRIPHRHLYDKSTSYRDVAAWVYALRSRSIVTALDIRWLEGQHDHLRQEFFVPDDNMVIRYANLKREREPILWEDGRFYEADEPSPAAQHSGILNHVSIRPETGNHIGFGFSLSSVLVVDRETGKFIRPYDPNDPLGPNEALAYDDTAGSETLSRPQETLVTVEVESSYFFRCVKLKDRVIIELNGQPMLTVEGAWPASQVGLLTEGQPCFFDGITLMHLPGE